MNRLKMASDIAVDSNDWRCFLEPATKSISLRSLGAEHALAMETRHSILNAAQS
jgi:hypothetical protein